MSGMGGEGSPSGPREGRHGLVRVEIGGGIARVILERPDAINAISTALATALAEA
jgi:enoyl-CoA hydratase/carnithine racemase